MEPVARAAAAGRRRRQGCGAPHPEARGASAWRGLPACPEPERLEWRRGGCPNTWGWIAWSQPSGLSATSALISTGAELRPARPRGRQEMALILDKANLPRPRQGARRRLPEPAREPGRPGAGALGVGRTWRRWRSRPSSWRGAAGRTGGGTIAQRSGRTLPTRALETNKRGGERLRLSAWEQALSTRHTRNPIGTRHPVGI